VPLASLLHFTVRGVFPAPVAEFPGLQPIGVLLLIFGRGVIAILALTTLQRNNFSHFSKFLYTECGPA
jgi:hypothetical protein